MDILGQGSADDRDVDSRCAVKFPGQCELTILMPCLNEAQTVAACIDKAKGFLRNSGLSGEVLVADNGSTDGSQALSVAHGARVVAVERRGYGAALGAGIAAARGRYIVMGDSDDSYDFAAIGDLVAALQRGSELVVGNRFAGNMQPGAMPLLHRYLGNPVLSFLGRLFFSAPVQDFHCGLRGFEKEAINKLRLSCDGMEFASEMIVKATLHGLRIAEVPVNLHRDGRNRPPHLRTWRDGWRHLRFLLLLSPRWLFLFPGALMLLSGVIIQGVLLPGPKTVNAITFDIHTMLFSSAAVVVGAQLLTFAAFAKVFVEEAGIHPKTRGVALLRKHFRLERALFVGGGLVLSGICLTVLAVAVWEQVGFGPFDPSVGMRILIPAFTVCMVGAQVILAGMFLSVLGLGSRDLWLATRGP